MAKTKPSSAVGVRKKPQNNKPTIGKINKPYSGGGTKTNKKKQHSSKPQYNHYEQQRLDRIREKDERKACKEEKLLQRKKERTKKLKILTKKNRKGQPIMGGRIELLLEKIKQSM